MLLQQLEYQNKNINYFLKVAKGKSISVKYQNEKIIVNAPVNLSKKMLEIFLISKWHILEKWIQAPKIRLFQLTDKPFVLFLGKEYPLVFQLKQKRNKLYFKDEQFTLNIKEFDEILIIKIINNFLKKNAMELLKNRIEIYSKNLQMPYQSMQVRLLKTKWGMCYYQKQKIILNYKIIHFASEIIDYVVIHELVHLENPNHSKSFWSKVQQYCPNYQEYQKYLKQIFL